ncbi:MAG: hypothetical protein DRO15_04805 [Thermoprotei archaeon]|nr:MAG: hypothetical protein DRO15_04805 [Thermoprotei archaeon]
MKFFTRRKRKEILTEEVKESVRKRVTKYLKRSSPGTYASLNKYYMIKSHRDFVNTLIEEPGECYQILVKYFNNYESAEFFIYCILERLLAFNPFYIASAMTALKEGNDNEFKKILAHALSRESMRTIII